MARAEFSKRTKRAALARAGEVCEVCLIRPVAEFDHLVPASIGGSNDLSNCIASCKKCHALKTRKRDVPQIAKSKRIAEKRAGVRRKGPAMAGTRRSNWKRKLDGTVERRS
jgi:5-methylcytosine-specific restriction endonuclease McrA